MGGRRSAAGVRKDLAPKELAEELNVSETTVKRRLRAGELPGYKNGRLWRTPRACLDALRGNLRSPDEQFISRARRLARFYGYHWHADDSYFNKFVELLEQGIDVKGG